MPASYRLLHQIKLIVSSVSKKSAKSSAAELESLVQFYGDEARVGLLQVLLEEIDLSAGTSRGGVHKDHYKILLFRKHMQTAFAAQNACSLVGAALKRLPLAKEEKASQQVLGDVAHHAELDIMQCLEMGMFLCVAPQDATTSAGRDFFLAQMAELKDQVNIISDNSVPLATYSKLLFFVNTFSGFSAEQRASMAAVFELNGFRRRVVAGQADSSACWDGEARPQETSYEARKHKEHKDVSFALLRSVPTNWSVLPPYQLVQDLGCAVTSHRVLLRRVLGCVPRMSDLNLALLLSMMLRAQPATSRDVQRSVFMLKTFLPLDSERKLLLAEQTQAGWNLVVFAEVLRDVYPRTNWESVFKLLDHPQFFVGNSAALSMLMEMHWRLTSDHHDAKTLPLAEMAATFPFSAFLASLWSNRTGQLSFLRHAIRAKLAIPSHETVPEEYLSASQRQSCWRSVGLLRVLFKLSETEVHPEAAKLLLTGFQEQRELVIYGLGLLQQDPGSAQQDVAFETNLSNQYLDILIPDFIRSCPADSAKMTVFSNLWALNHYVVRQRFKLMFHRDPSVMPAVVAMLKALPGGVDFCLQEANRFSFWLAASMAKADATFIFADFVARVMEPRLKLRTQCLSMCIIFLRENLSLPKPDGDSASARLLDDEDKKDQLGRRSLVRVCEAELKVVVSCIEQAKQHELTKKQHSEVASLLRQVRREYRSAEDMLREEAENRAAAELVALEEALRERESSALPVAPKVDVRMRKNDSAKYYEQVSLQATRVMEAVFRKDYDERNILQATDYLRALKTSSKPFERDVFQCVLHNTLKECRCLTDYPEKQLRQAAVLLGRMITLGLLDNMGTGIALRYMLAALRAPPSSGMFRFGMWSLDEIKHWLHKWPVFCALVLALDSVRTVAPGIAGVLQRVVAEDIAKRGVAEERFDGTLHGAGGAGGFPPAAAAAATVATSAVGGPEGTEPNLALGPLQGSDAMVRLKSASARDVLQQQTGLGLLIGSRPGSQALAVAGPDSKQAYGTVVGGGRASFASPSRHAASRPAPPGMTSPGVSLAPPGVKPSESPFNSILTNEKYVNLVDEKGNARGAGDALQEEQQDADTFSQQRGASSFGDQSMNLRGRGGVAQTRGGVSGSSQGRANAASASGAQAGGSIMSATGRGNAPQAAAQKIKTPPENIRDQFHFIINNVDDMNVKAKGKQMREILLANLEFLPYMTHYMVVRRVAQEANRHALYAEFLESIAIRQLHKQMVRTTYDTIAQLIRSNKVVKQSSERTLLKNLGIWLGMLTVARNRPLLAKYINLKQLLLVAYETKRLVAIIPFVAKVLEQCKNSVVFKLPNPWLNTLVCILKELYDSPDLKLNMNFQLGVLFNSLSIDTKKLAKTNMLAKYMEHRTFAEGMSSTHSPPMSGYVDDSMDSDMKESDLKNMRGVPANFVKVHPQIALVTNFPFLKNLIPSALERAIKDIVNPVVERSVSIACITTRDLVTKDFAMEPDENKMRGAAVNMVTSLTTNLALVTCKELLRLSISNRLSQLLGAKAQGVAPQIEQACTQIANDNIDIARRLIEKAAAERAKDAVEDVLRQAFVARRQHQERNSGQPFIDMQTMNTPAGRFTISLPEFLRARNNGRGLFPNQLSVYDDYGSASTSFTAIANMYAKSGDDSGPATAGATGPSSGALTMNTQQTLDRLVACFTRIQETVLRVPKYTQTPLSTVWNDGNHELKIYLRMIPAMLQQCSRDSAAMSFDAVILAFANKIAKALYHPDFSNSLLHRDVYMYLLEALKNAVPLVATQLTQWLLQTPQDGSQPKLFNLEMTCAYLKHNLLHIVDVDKYLAEQVRELAQQHGPSLTHFNMRLEFVINLVRRCVVQQRYVVVTELPFLFGNLSKMTQGHIQSGSKLGDTLIRLLEDVQAAAARSRGDKTKNSDFPGEGDPDELDIEFARQMRAVFAEQIPNETKHRIVRLFEEWMAICSQGSGNDKQYALYLERLQQQRVLATPGSSVTFFRVIVEACVSSAYAHLVDVPQHQEQQQTGALNARQQAISNFLADEAKSQSTGVLRYHAIDALAKFVVFLSKFLDPSGQTPPQQPTNNVNRMILFKWFLTTVVWGILKDHSAQQEQFNQRPYLRLLVNIMQELNSPDPVLDSNNVDVLLILAHCLMLLRPTRIPTFAFAWLELVSHRTFMSKMLLSKNPNCSRALSRLLIDVFRFMRPSLAAADLSSGMRLLYRGTLRIILVLLHDFPEFLCEYHFAFCDVIPSSCVQARNLILSAFPRNMRLPDPFTPNLKVDMLPEIAHAPRISSDVLGALEAHRNQIMHPLEQYLKMIGKGQHVQVSPHIFAALRYTSSGNSLAVAKQIIKAGTVYDVPLINALVLFVGCQAIAKNNANKNPNQQGHDLMSQFRDNACFEFFASLINNLDAEGRYHVLNAIANQLRFPNAHTHYFSCCTLYLFLRAENEVIVEQITRVLVERLMVHRPHPWGLLITFVELIKNRRYELWKRGFHNMAPEIERLFEKVARSCMPGKDGQPPSGQGQGGSGQQQQPPQNL